MFDFRNFDPVAYDSSNATSSWHTFVPARDIWDATLWIELKIADCAEFIDGNTLLAQWRANGGGRRIMANIEAAHIGPIAETKFARVMNVDRVNQTYNWLL